MIKTRLSGFKDLRANIRTFRGKMAEAAKEEIIVHWMAVLEVSQDLVPEAKGVLRDSARLVVSPNGYSVTIVYGGPGIPYAIPVHEHLSVHSPYSWRVAEARGKGINWTKVGTGPKFLERPMMAAVGQLPRKLRDGLRVERTL